MLTRGTSSAAAPLHLLHAGQVDDPLRSPYMKQTAAVVGVAAVSGSLHDVGTPLVYYWVLGQNVQNKLG